LARGRPREGGRKNMPSNDEKSGVEAAEMPQGVFFLGERKKKKGEKSRVATHENRA